MKQIEVPNDLVFVRVKEKDILLHGSKVLLWDGNEIVPAPESEDEVEEDEVEEDEVDEDEVDEDEDEVEEDEVDEDLYGSHICSINVHTLGPEQNRRVGDCVVADVYCNNCCDHLGIKFIEVRDDDARVKDMDILLCASIFKAFAILVLLILVFVSRSKLLMWDGTQVIYARDVEWNPSRL
ncbi:hypothetical protein RHMOL_Rhmol13G0105400 [Rhododendron molle]|uniref:Uncharacterized protein n=1 Tax=Rhododendron molle TaxID=49168 RepID=A0ACC0L6A5_RHOML|nr:hypothetical protein RHMOL_Rhmol13G0105400 [Rhododendron molle]